MSDMWLIIAGGQVMRVVFSAAAVDIEIEELFKNHKFEMIVVENWKKEENEKAHFYSSDCYYRPR